VLPSLVRDAPLLELSLSRGALSLGRVRSPPRSVSVASEQALLLLSLSPSLSSLSQRASRSLRPSPSKEAEEGLKKNQMSDKRVSLQSLFVLPSDSSSSWAAGGSADE
jgi:hypothetical protein